MNANPTSATSTASHGTRAPRFAHGGGRNPNELSVAWPADDVT